MNGVYLSAETVYNTLCKSLDNDDIKYSKDDSKLAVSVSSKTDDFDIQIYIMIDRERHAVKLFSRLPFTVPDDKKLDLSVATNFVNSKFVNGHFDFDISSGTIVFKLTNTYIGYKTIGTELFGHLLGICFGFVDEYNDKFFMLSKGLMELGKFIEMENE